MKSLLRFALLAFMIVLSGSVAAQNSILWEVSGNGLEKPSYLLGTLKFIGEKEFYLPEKMLGILQKSELFAIEDQVDHHAQHELNKELHFPDQKSLASVMSAEDYQKVKEFFQNEFNIKAKVFEKKYAKLKPLAISIAMTRLSLHEGVKYYDIELLKEAKGHKVETYSLEPIEREARALNSFPIEAQVEALLHSVNNFETQKKEYVNLEAAFVKGDIDKVFLYTIHPFENNIEFINEFYTKRNNEWIPKIEDMMKNKKSFIAVGIAHLKGENGLISLLKSKGYTIQPVNLN